MKHTTIFLLLGCITQLAVAQSSPVYQNLPVGSFPVGFRILTLTDESRISVPEVNYLGEKNIGDRARKITVHIWYPAATASGTRVMTYSDYGYSSLMKSSAESIPEDRKRTENDGHRRSLERWFGKATDEAWKSLVETPMLGHTEATMAGGKFPLLIGMLRPLSTTITNELLASNGYIVAMVKGENAGTFSEAALKEIPDIQFVMNYLEKNLNCDGATIGAFGFSGSGFTQVLLAMFDSRIKALADLESGIYMEGLFQALSLSNFYNQSKPKAPFLHLFSRDLSKQEKYIVEFEKKTLFSTRYRVLLNQGGLHHWDFATEGYTSCVVLKNRGAEQVNIQRSYEIAQVYLLNFFNAELKHDSKSRSMLLAKPTLEKIPSSLWDVQVLNAVKAPPDRDEFELIIRSKGIHEALSIVHTTIENDSTVNIRQGFVLNSMGYRFLNEKKYAEAIGIFTLNEELHPDAAGWVDSLAEAYELSGDAENRRKTSRRVLDILARKNTLTADEQSLKEMAEKRLK